MSKPAPRKFDVVRTVYVTPHMLCITLQDNGINKFPADQASAYIKLIFPQPGDAGPLLRTYTVRQQRANELE
jgi:NADPH-dependent ferric siderophore reductase